MYSSHVGEFKGVGEESFEIHLVQLFFALKHFVMLDLYKAWDNSQFQHLNIKKNFLYRLESRIE